MPESRDLPHVVIVGGGFAGVACAQDLAKSGKARVTLLDKNNYHQFQPLLYQVATSQLGPGDVAYSLRKLFAGKPNVDVKLAEVVAVDPQTRTVSVRTGETYTGDYLVLAIGSQPNFFKTPGADKFAYPLYSLNDAERLRSRILEVFEDVDREPMLTVKGALNVVVVGAGATGVEIAGALAEMFREVLPAEYPDLYVGAATITLIDHGHTVLAPFSNKAHDYAEKVLRESGVELRLNTGVSEVTAGHVVLSDGSRLPSHVVIWAGGLMASSLENASGLPIGRGGRVDVLPDLTVKDHPLIYALGDFANTPGADGKALPQLGSVAQQAGKWAAKNILADASGAPRTDFQYHDKGIMAMINRKAAVVEIGPERHELHGRVAAAAWLGVHASLMSGVRPKVGAFMEWVWARFSMDRGPQLLDRSDTPRIDWSDDA